MSWAEPAVPHELFGRAANRASPSLDPRPFTIQDVWEISPDAPSGRWLPHPIKPNALIPSSELRIVFAPLDLALPSSRDGILDLFNILSIPSAFSTERVKSVSHSFAAIADADGTSTWFHFLCKNVSISNDPQNFGVTYHAGADVSARRNPTRQAPLPQADYSYIRSGFFMRTTAAGTTLTCFGATPNVRGLLHGFSGRTASYHDAISEPYVLLDIVLEGLFHDVDDNVWNMNTVFGAFEHLTLSLAQSRHERNIGKKMPFVELHNIAKHVIHLNEAVESCLLVVDRLIEEIDRRQSSNATPLGRTASESTTNTLTSSDTTTQLRSRLLYRKSLFKSTELRLNSLSKRVDNAINLAFNMVTQQDSMLMIQDSSSMKIIAAITLLFLPTTTVATVAGSQMFLTSLTGEDWLIQASPLYMTMWSISIPLTIVVGTFALAWHWWMHSEQQERVVEVVRRKRIGLTGR